MKNAYIPCNAIEIIWSRKNEDFFFDIFLTLSSILSTLAQMESPTTYKPYLNEGPMTYIINFRRNVHNSQPSNTKPLKLHPPLINVIHNKWLTNYYDHKLYKITM
jgi:hypothetical protein